MISPSDSVNEYTPKKTFKIYILCLLLIAVASIYSSSAIIGGGDTWIALACGRHYTAGDWVQKDQNRTVQMKLLDYAGVHISRHDSFSPASRKYSPGTKGSEGWINQNWLTHVVFYKLYSIGGGTAIVIYKFLQTFLTIFFIFQACVTLGVPPSISAMTSSLGILMSRSYIDLRPNVSSIFFAAILIYIFALWKKGRVKAMLGLLPLMMLWSNIHGGFIYAIVVLGILLVTYGVVFFIKEHPLKFILWVPDKSQMKYLLYGLCLACITPMILSPFGIENLLHPLLVTIGDDAKIWQQIAEWRSIFDANHYGNAEPYKYFLIVLGITFLVHLQLKLFVSNRIRKDKKFWKKNIIISEICYKYDMGLTGIIVFTIYISINSSRFVYLSSALCSVYIALMIHEIITLFPIKAQLKTNKNLKSIANALLFLKRQTPIFAILFLTGIMIYGVSIIKKDYFSKDFELIKPVFQRMTGFKSQPDNAMKFINKNHIAGTVLCEWTNAGYVLFSQQQKDISLPLKVFMDGRAQAAYDVEHYKKYMSIRNRLILKSKKITKLKKQYHKKGVPLSLKKQLITKINKLNKETKTLYNNLSNHGITAILFFKNQSIFDTLINSDHWEIAYIDNRHMLFLNNQILKNIPLLQKPYEQLQYPTKAIKKRTIEIRKKTIQRA